MNWKRLVTRTTAAAITWVWLPACDADPATPFLRAYVGHYVNAATDFQPYFIVDEAAKWPSRDIEVCWEASAAPYSAEQKWVRTAVAQFIEKNSGFIFNASWAACDKDMRPRIRIIVIDSDGVAAESEVGYQAGSNGRPPSPTYMRMNFTFQTWNYSCAGSEAKRQLCIKTIAVHEFLHAVGALHEQLRPDLQQRDPSCWAKYKNSPDIHGKLPLALTDYDPDSIMNYCKDIYSVPTQLSALDLVGLKKLSDSTGIS
jgi:hypothetical protein